ncbi:MAG: GNAT family N-acetyltransferase [Phycicoccus sp.]
MRHLVEVRVVDDADLAPWVDDLAHLLQQRYGGPPWNESEAENRAAAELFVAEAATTRTVVAVQDGRLVGAAQGGPGATFGADLLAADPAAAGEFRGEIFELRQLLVAPAVAARGIGGRLHDTVLDGVRLSQLLITHPAARQALHLYARRGWRWLADTEFGPEHPRVILGRSIPPER